MSGACLAVPRVVWQRVGGFAERVLHVPRGRRPLAAPPPRGGGVGVEPARGRRPRLRVRQGRGEVAAARAQPLGDDHPLLPGRAAARCSRPRCSPRSSRCSPSRRAGGWLPQKLAAAGETLRALPRLLRERRAIQATRAVERRGVRRLARRRSSTRRTSAPSRACAPLRWALRGYWRLVLTALRRADRPLARRGHPLGDPRVRVPLDVGAPRDALAPSCAASRAALRRSARGSRAAVTMPASASRTSRAASLRSPSTRIGRPAARYSYSLPVAMLTCSSPVMSSSVPAAR